MNHMAGELVFVHLSDIHFRCDSGNTYDVDEDLRNELLLDARDLAATLGKPDGILISGDIAFSGADTEYAKAKDWIQLLCDAVGSTLADVWCVPGNHDVDQTCVKQSQILRDVHQKLRACDQHDLDALINIYMGDRVAKRLLFDTITQYNRFAAMFKCQLGPEGPVWQKDLELEDGSVLRLCGLNSTIVSDHTDNDSQTVLLGRHQVPNRELGVTNLVICHHPPDWWGDSETVDQDLANRARVQLFGHKHSQRLDKINNTLRVSAGAVHPDRREPNWTPRYNWLILGVSSTNGNRQLNVAVHPRVWSTTVPRFIPDSNSCGGQDYQQFSLALEAWTPPPEPDTLVNPCHATATIPAATQYTAATESSTMDPARILTYRFFELAHVARVGIARTLNLLKDEDEGLQDFQLFDRVFQRAVETGSLSELWEKVEECHDDGKHASNPFAEES